MCFEASQYVHINDTVSFHKNDDIDSTKFIN